MLVPANSAAPNGDDWLLVSDLAGAAGNNEVSMYAQYGSGTPIRKVVKSGTVEGFQATERSAAGISFKFLKEDVSSLPVAGYLVRMVNWRPCESDVGAHVICVHSRMGSRSSNTLCVHVAVLAPVAPQVHRACESSVDEGGHGLLQAATTCRA